MDKSISYTDLLEITYKNKDAEAEFINVIHPLRNSSKISCRWLTDSLPASIDILIHEYDREFPVEHREMIKLGDELYGLQLIKEYIALMVKEGDTLYITDPYLLRCCGDDLDNLLMLLSNCKNVNVKSIIPKKNYDEIAYQNISKALNSVGSTFHVIFNKDIHDRFWITDKYTGFVIGTSMNGLAKHVSCINKLPFEDCREILDFINAII